MFETACVSELLEWIGLDFLLRCCRLSRALGNEKRGNKVPGGNKNGELAVKMQCREAQRKTIAMNTTRSVVSVAAVLAVQTLKKTVLGDQQSRGEREDARRYEGRQSVKINERLLLSQ